jgi:hypothetical protein
MLPDGLPIWATDTVPGHLHNLTCVRASIAPTNILGNFVRSRILQYLTRRALTGHRARLHSVPCGHYGKSRYRDGMLVLSWRARQHYTKETRHLPTSLPARGAACWGGTVSDSLARKLAVSGFPAARHEHIIPVGRGRDH